MTEENKKTKILIVEDDLLLLNIYMTLFKDEGFDVLSAKTGEEGYRLIVEEAPEIVLLDILLPGTMDGLEVLKKMKSQASTRDIPVMIMSNLSDDITISNGMALGASGYFAKSQFNPSDVLRNVRTLIRK